jgi:hypothetical protein
MTSSDAGPEPTAAAPAPPETAAPVPVTPGHAASEAGSAVIAPPGLSAGEPAAPEQSREDTDAAWGEYPESADDRLHRDRPPHWDNF